MGRFAVRMETIGKTQMIPMLSVPRGEVCGAFAVYGRSAAPERGDCGGFQLHGKPPQGRLSSRTVPGRKAQGPRAQKSR